MDVLNLNAIRPLNNENCLLACITKFFIYNLIFYDIIIIGIIYFTISNTVG